MENYTITNVGLDDIAVLKKIEIECELSPWTIGSYESEQKRPYSVMLKVQGERGEICGFILGRVPVGGGEAEIYNIGVAPSFRRRGIGSMLIGAFRRTCAERRIATLWLEVRAANLAAIEFYSSHGFRQNGLRPKFYSDPPDDAVLMSLGVL